ncbi:MAG: dihydroorotase, partial [Chroococcales cyanobacterium]
HLQFWGALTMGSEGSQMTELAELAEAGVIGFTDGRAIANLGLLRRLLEYVKPLNKPVALMASDRQLRGNGTMREGKLSIRYGLPGNPTVSETAALAAILEVVAEVGTPVHLMRLSTARSVELIGNAKSRGIPVTASTTWMHLLLETKALSSYDPSLHLHPPLGNPDDRMALVEGVKTGVIDAIAIDHIAYTYEEKTVAFSEAPSGAIGLELALPLLWQTFVESGEWTALELWKALSLSPQKCLYQQPTRCQVGENAELVLFDPQKTWTANPTSLKSMGENTPWLNNLLTGKVVRTWNN